ncbi:tetratricopeptide repeat protein [Candidatus Poribacteria bacterium]
MKSDKQRGKPKSRKGDAKQKRPRKSAEPKAQPEPAAASLDSLYDSLPEPAQELFARMSFFPGGLFRGFNDLWELLGDSWEDIAEEIVHSKLATYDESTDRYSMTEPVIEYARGKLDESESDDFRRRATEFWAEFVQWYDLMLDVQLAEQEEETEALKLPDDPSERQDALESLRSNSFAMMAVEENNVIHAAEWALSAGDETGLGIVDSLEDYLDLKNRWDTKERLYRLALSRRRQLAAAEPGEYMPDVAGTLNSMGKLLREMGKIDDAKPCFEEALRIYRDLSLSDPDVYMPDAAITLNNVGALYAQTGNPDEGLAYYKESLGIYRELFRRYPSAYTQDYLAALNGVMEVCEKLGMEERIKECRQEIEEISQAIDENNET